MSDTLYSTNQDVIKKASALILTFFAVVLFSISSTVHAQNGATVSSINGYATVTDSEGNVKRLKSGDAIKEGDIISTGSSSSLELTLADGRIVSIGELASFKFNADAIAGLPSADNLGSGSTGTVKLTEGSTSLSAAVSAGGSPVE